MVISTNYIINWQWKSGFRTEVNQPGVDYYNNLLDALEEAGIEPLVTMFHLDTPLTLTYLGDWTSRKMVDYFLEYADLLFQLFGDRVMYSLVSQDYSS